MGTECRLFYPSTITIHVGSFGLDTKGGVHPQTGTGHKSYIKIPELYGQRNLFVNGSFHQRGHGLVVLENRFGTLLKNKTFDTWGGNKRRTESEFDTFLSSLEKDCIL